MIRIIESLGGIYNAKINVDVFCVLVKKVGSTKHTQAKSLKIPLVQIQWLHDCRKQNEKLQLEKYMIKCFVGLVTCCIGYVTVCNYWYCYHTYYL